MPVSGQQPKVRGIATYGWRPDLPDIRDRQYSATAPKATQLPNATDLRPKCPPVYDQGQLGSCTANAIAAAVEFCELENMTMPSRLFIYYNERVIEGTINTDSGAQIRDGMKSVATQGVCPESEWPYIITKFSQQPFKQCYDDALKTETTQYLSLQQDLTQLKTCLAEGFPFVFGFTVYESFESQAVAQSGVLNMPDASEKIVGGHAVMAVGYDDAASRVLIRNSWGTDWGMAGYFTMPYNYITDRDLASDFWTVRQVS
jgi:C1A family cysteine protease